MRKQSKVLTLIFGVLWLTSTTTTQSFEWSDWQRYATFCSMPAMPMLPQFITHPLQHLAEFFDTKAMGFLAGGALLGGIAVYVWQQMAIKKINEKNTKLCTEKELEKSQLQQQIKNLTQAHNQEKNNLNQKIQNLNLQIATIKKEVTIICTQYREIIQEKESESLELKLLYLQSMKTISEVDDNNFKITVEQELQKARELTDDLTIQLPQSPLVKRKIKLHRTKSF